jgi:hypothetical protein
MTGSAGYITGTIGLPDPAQLSAHPLYTRAACAHTGASPRENFAFLKTILDQVQVLHAVSRGENRATFGADEILARDTLDASTEPQARFAAGLMGDHALGPSRKLPLAKT